MIKIDGFIVVRKDNLGKSNIFHPYYELYNTYADAQAVIDKIGLIAFCVIPVCRCEEGEHKYYLRVPNCVHI